MHIFAGVAQRYVVRKVLAEKPVLLCEVEWLKDENDSSTEELSVAEVATQSRQLFLDTLALSNKSKGNIENFAGQLEEELKSMTPRELSFWMTRVFNGATEMMSSIPFRSPLSGHLDEKQRMASSTSIRERFMKANVVLTETRNFLSAKAALQAAFADDEGKGDKDNLPPRQ